MVGCLALVIDEGMVVNARFCVVELVNLLAKGVIQE
jgi:hypothetical protein